MLANVNGVHVLQQHELSLVYSSQILATQQCSTKLSQSLLVM